MTVTTLDEVIKRMEAGFWRRYNSNPELRRKLAGKDRVLQLVIPDGESHWFHIVDGKLHDIHKGTHAKPNATVTVKEDDLLAVFNGELGAMQAYMTGRVKVKASFADMLFAKSLIGG